MGIFKMLLVVVLCIAIAYVCMIVYSKLFSCKKCENANTAADVWQILDEQLDGAAGGGGGGTRDFEKKNADIGTILDLGSDSDSDSD